MADVSSDDVTIIAQREPSSMVSCWNEYLCLHRVQGDRWRLDIRGFEVAANVGDFEDDDEGDTILPDEIDGVRVVGIEDEWVVVDRLLECIDQNYPIAEFSASELVKVKTAFEGEWYSDEIELKILDSVSSDTQTVGKLVRYLVVTVDRWPDGTRSMHLGSVLNRALDKSMQLLEMGPPRVFKARSDVTEDEFWQILNDADFSSDYGIEFKEQWHYEDGRHAEDTTKN